MNKILFSSENENWETPKELFEKLNKEFNFTIDAMANSKNKLCEKYYTIENSFLYNKPKNEIIYCNPPYSRQMGKIIEHCNNLRYLNNTIVLLIPSRTDTKWFHEYIYNKDGVEIRFIKGRLKFTLNKKEHNTSTFPSMIVIMKPKKDELLQLKEKKCKNCKYNTGIQCHGHGEFWANCKLLVDILTNKEWKKIIDYYNKKNNLNTLNTRIDITYSIITEETDCKLYKLIKELDQEMKINI